MQPLDVAVASSKCPTMTRCCFLFELQYSQKEDKYEEEIKVLTDKLKEVSPYHLLLLLHGSLTVDGGGTVESWSDTVSSSG